MSGRPGREMLPVERAVRGGGKVVPLHRQLAAAEPAADGDGARMSAATLQRAALCKRLDDLMLAGDLNATQAIAALRAQEAAAPSANTLRRWFQLWRGGGAAALADRRSGRARMTYGWEARAVELWNQPVCAARSTVAMWLRQEGWSDASESRVRRYLKSLPASVGGEHTPARRGAHHHRQNHTPHVVRDQRALEVGMLYEGDGHTCDVFCKHPATGKHFRPELTVWIDVRSHFVAGWYLSQAESRLTSLWSLSKTFVTHDHVPAALHVDPGSGYKNKMLQDETVGWLTRLGVTVMHARPGNARGKGLIEGWFRWFEERCGKRFDSYCGWARTDDDLRRIDKSIKEGKVNPPSIAEYGAAIDAYCRAYNANPQARLQAAPCEVWAELKRSPVGMSEAQLLRPAEIRTVRRAGITLYNRTYRHPALNLVNDKKVEVEFDLTCDRKVWVNYRGRRVCEALKTDAKPWAEQSIIDDWERQRLAGQTKRLERHLAEAEARARKPLDGAAVAIEALPGPEETPAFDPFDCLPE